MNKWLTRSMKSRTVKFGFFLTIMGTLQASLGVFTPYMTPELYGIVGVIVGMIVAGLRFLTTKPMTDK